MSFRPVDILTIDIILQNNKYIYFNIAKYNRHIVPVLNPDGYEYTHTQDRMWRKNRASYGGECVGVDLNRNFRYL